MTYNRRGETIESVIAVFCILVLVVLGLIWMSSASYNSGYRDGQIDALEGTVEYKSVESPAGDTYWYKQYLPSGAKLYPSRKKDD